MSNKPVMISLILCLLAVFGVFMGGGCAPNKEQKKGEGIKQAEAIPPPTQGYKTYISRFGFSMVYPAELEVDEEKKKPAENDLNGYVPFVTQNEYADKIILVNYVGQVGIVKHLSEKGNVIPVDPKARVWYLAKFTNAIDAVDPKNKVIDLKEVKGQNVKIYLLYYANRRISGVRAMFYIEKTDTLCDLMIAFLDSSKEERYKTMFLNILKTIRISK